MIRRLLPSDFSNILSVINDAAQAYRGVIPDDRWKQPYISAGELESEIEAGVKFFVWEEDDTLVAVGGIQFVKDSTLVRHTYVATKLQRKGIGSRLLRHLTSLARTPEILVGTWADATWAIRFYEKHGFRLLSAQEKDLLLRVYWNIPDRQVESSVVLKLIAASQGEAYSPGFALMNSLAQGQIP
jgi:GNAT superfamily N-acetyltransferase